LLSDSHYQKLDSAYQRLTDLADKAKRLPEEARKVVQAALSELSLIHLEMQTLLEEFSHHNDELAASRAALEDERRRYQELFEFAPDGYLVTDKNGIILEANSAAIDLLQIDRQLIAGKPLSSFVVDEEKEAYHRKLKELQKGKIKKTVDWQISLKPWKSEPFPASFTAGVVCNTEGKVTGLRWLFSDISWRKKMEEEILKTDKLESISLLAGGIAHDFNNLLANLMGHISLARLWKDNPEKVAQKLDLSEKVIVRAKELLQQLFQFSKKDYPHCKVFALSKIIYNILDLSCDNSQIKYFCNLPADLLPLEADEAQISQVIQNIIINAKQAMPDGGIITITAENIFTEAMENYFLPLAKRDYLRISISDTGIGIPEELKMKIFDPFFTTKEEGTGLGLATSYFLIKKNGGYITVDSKPGVGTIFYLYLPAWRQKNEHIEKKEEDFTN